nr:glycosyltransferase family 1 protein [Novipirellula artificiosorum]
MEQLLETNSVHLTLFADRPEYPIAFSENEHAEHEIFEFRGDRFSAWEQVGLPRRAKARRVDLLFCPGTYVPLWQPVPTIVTIHDTIGWQSRSLGVRDRFIRHRLLPLAYRKCREIITISNSSKRDIEDRFSFLRNRCTVIHHGLDPSYQDICEKPKAFRLNLPQQLSESAYVLYVGGNIPRKRPDWAIKVFSESASESAKLVMLGVDAIHHKNFLAEIPESIRPRIVVFPFLSEEIVAALYSHATAVLYPTLYEGFGFPVLQANAFGVPVLHSAVGSLKELVGPSSIVVEPEDFTGWCQQLKICFEGKRDARAVSRLWARTFCWEKSAELHLQVFRRCLKVT